MIAARIANTLRHVANRMQPPAAPKRHVLATPGIVHLAGQHPVVPGMIQMVNVTGWWLSVDGQAVGVLHRGAGHDVELEHDVNRICALLAEHGLTDIPNDLAGVAT